MSASPCESADAASEREDGDMGCSLLGGSSHLVRIWKGTHTPQDEIGVFVSIGLMPGGLKKSVDCEVKVLELTPLSICLVTLVKTVYIRFAHLCSLVLRSFKYL